MLQQRASKDGEAFRLSQSYFSTDQVGRQSNATNASHRSSFLRKISPTSASNSSRNSVDLQRDFTADYLRDLRKNRPPRPSGARPLPERNVAATPTFDGEIPGRTASALAFRSGVPNVTVPDRSSSATGHKRAQIASENREDAGRPLVRQPNLNRKSRDFSGATADTSTTAETKDSKLTNETSSSGGSESKRYSIPYYERGQRWMEKQEASSLRHALEDKDKMDEVRVFAAAQDEAAELVWRHQNPQDPGVPYKNPDASYRHHLRKGSHTRSQSIGPYTSLYVKKSGGEGQRLASDGSNSSGGGRVVSNGSNSSGGASADAEDERGRGLQRMKAYGSLKQKFAIAGPRALIRNRSGSAKARKTSGESQKSSLFRNPNDHIYEEPEDVIVTQPVTVVPTKPQPLASKPRNTSYGSQGIKTKLGLSEKEPVKMVSSIDIHRNPPSQSRNAFYRRNESSPGMDSLPEPLPTKEGREIRGDDIRAATSMKRGDRSERLPMPTVVSDRPGRPIVSFANDYKPRERDLKEQSSSRPSTHEGPDSEVPVVPAISISDVPAINLPEETSSITVTETPSVNISPSPATGNQPLARPLPSPAQASHPQSSNWPHPSSFNISSNASRSTPHWSPAGALRGAAQCAYCALPISGRSVRAANQRYHPTCFTCHQCGTQLECVAFYPEPDEKRVQRLVRIEARLSGQAIVAEQAHFTEEHDGDDGMRFYCHLDFHENFSPRCRHCKTPVEGEVVLACGGEWHVGHFFCAECGDPFDSKTPFVEKDGYAWCTKCHTNRFSGKCAGCKKPIVDTVIKALDREWHEGCFVCCECGGDFGDGSFFVRQDGDMKGLPVCKGCEERRLKA